MLNHCGTKTIETKRLILRPFTVEDAEDMFENWASRPRVTRFLSWSAHPSPEHTRGIIESWLPEYEKPDYYNWAIEIPGHGVCGNVSVVGMDTYGESAELGYCLSTDFWSGGVMTEAVKAVRDFLFGEVGLHRLIIRHAPANPASGRVAQKCGFTMEGTSREAFKLTSGEFTDMIVYSILVREWNILQLTVDGK